jgi:HAD superfamily hydrolase (TIGR01458 family)
MIQAVLLDLDGVLYVGNQVVNGAAQAIQRLHDAGIKAVGVTNTTTQAKHSVAKKLQKLGIPLDEQHLFTPASLVKAYIGNKTARLYIRDDLQTDLQVTQSDTKPDYIVMGDIGGLGYPPQVLHEIFLHLMQGAELLALHKNRFWQKEDGLHLDLGTWVAALEYASGKQAKVFGKPSQDFFLHICQQLHVPPTQTLMVGDDIESDILGAQQAGLQTALVQTGKYNAAFVEQTGIQSNTLLQSIDKLYIK